MLNSNFKFHFPLEIKKSKDDGKDVMRLGGIASTIDEDSDGEFLDPKGFVLEDFLEYGLVNWHHQSKDKPSTIIGEPYLAEIRKDGLYVECNLYPTSEIAREVYELANVMGKDSKRRKLGFSIEGSVIEKDENNPKIIKKAVITGLAITHMPKNPKTFADIIKGKGLCKDLNEQDEDLIDKSTSTETAGALVRESVDGYTFKELKEEETYDEIFKVHPDLSIKKAEQLYNFLNKTKEAMRKTDISAEKLSKAMEILGFESDNSKNPFLQKGKKTPHQIATDIQKEMFTDEEEEDPKSVKEKNVDGIQKSIDLSYDPLDKGAVLLVRKIFEKGMKDNSERQNALGVLIKAQLENSEELFEKFSKLEKAQVISNGIVSDLKEELEKANSLLSGLGESSVGRRSITKGYSEKESFQKSKEESKESSNVLSKSRNFSQVLNIIDSYCDSKGMRQDLSKAVIEFESSKMLPMAIISEIKTELGITIVD